MSSRGVTPLFLAVEADSLDLVNVLLTAGAQPKLKLEGAKVGSAHDRAAQLLLVDQSRFQGIFDAVARPGTISKKRTSFRHLQYPASRV